MVRRSVPERVEKVLKFSSERKHCEKHTQSKNASRGNAVLVGGMRSKLARGMALPGFGPQLLPQLEDPNVPRMYLPEVG